MKEERRKRLTFFPSMFFLFIILFFGSGNQGSPRYFFKTEEKSAAISWVRIFGEMHSKLK